MAFPDPGPGGNEYGSSGYPVPSTTGGPQVSGIQELLAMLAQKGVSATQQNVSRARQARAYENQGAPAPTDTVDNSTSTTTRTRTQGGNQATVGKPAPSGGPAARDIEGGGDLPTPPIPPKSGAPPINPGASPAQTDASMSTGGGGSAGNTSAPPTSSVAEPGGFDPAALIGLLPSAAGIGAAALAARYGGGGGEFIGNSGGMPSGRSMDVPPDPLLAGPRGPQLGAPPPIQEAMIPETNPLQLALARAIEPMGAPSGTPTTPQMGGPQTGAPGLPAPGPRPPIAMPDSTSGPTITASDMRPIPPGAGVAPGPASPTQVGRTASPAANPNAIRNPPVDPSRFRGIIDALMQAGRGMGGRPMRAP